jgi:hypothetical protein
MSSSNRVQRGISFSVALMLCLVVLAFQVSVASAIDELNWAFQSVGYTAYGNPPMQTAVAMRDGQTWPVVFSESQNMLQAYSLYPVTNPTTNTNWFQIGSNLIQDPGSTTVLSAATSPDGRFGAVLRKVGSANSTAIVGSSLSGFGAAMPGVQAIDFDPSGNLIKGTLSTIPSINGATPAPLVDIAASSSGDIGAIDAMGKYYQKIALAGVWGSIDLKPLGLLPTTPDSIDLAIDSFGRPHIVANVIGQPQSPSIVAFDFDVPTGQWKKQVLATGAVIPTPFGATIATDSRGRVGAAWVEGPSAPNTTTSLMYAYKDGNQDWVTQTVVTNTSNPIFFGSSFVLPTMQRVGLTFDANDLPVISFAGQDRKIWLAYDPLSPIASVPEPSTLALLALGVLCMLFTVGKSRSCRS